MMMMNSILTTLLAVSTSTAAADAASSDYEAKIQAALDNYAAHSNEILQRAFHVGSNNNAIDTVEIDANGDILPSSSSSATLYADFGLKAVNEALGRINKANLQKSDANVYEEAFGLLTAQNNNNDSHSISYTQLEKWEDIVDLIDELKDGEFLTLWQKATGSESQEGEMNLSQFETFNNLLDKLLMAKIDFMGLTKGNKKEEIPYYRLYEWPALSEDMSDKDFYKLWKKAVGEDVIKGVMNYSQFLVFYDIAEEWMERDVNDENYDSGDSGDDDDEGNEEDEFGLAGTWLEHEYRMNDKSTVEQGEDVLEKSGWSSDEDEDDSGDYYHGLRASDYLRTDYNNIADADLTEDLKADLESDDEEIRLEAKVRRGLDPKRWTEFSYWELHAYFACDKIFSSPRPIWTDQQWRELRDFYHEFVEEDKEDEDSPKGLHSYQLTEDQYDLTQNAIPFQSGEKGRGLQAVRDIKAGELVFKATNNTIVFNYGHTWRKLLFAVNERFADPGITCDIMVWSWVQDLYDGGPLKIVMDLDSGSLLNEGRDGIPGWEAPNVQCGKPDATRCDMDYFAFRDIKEGDELLIDYNEFAFVDSWPDMGV